MDESMIGEQFTGIWMPAKLVKDKTFKGNNKILYAHILGLYKATGEVFASNQYFADIMSTSQRRIKIMLSQLENKQFIRRNIIYKDRTTVDKRYIIPLKYL